MPSIAEQHAFLDSARSYEFVDVRNKVLENNAYVNVQPAGRWSALHQAAQAGCEATVKFLLDHGASTDVVNKDGQKPWQVTKSAAIRALLGGEGGAKREAPAADLPGEPAAKHHVANPVQLTVNLVSGETMATLDADSTWTAEDVRKALAPHVQPGMRVQQLVVGDKKLEAGSTLSDVGLEEKGDITATLNAVPVLHLFKPCSAEDLSDRHGEWLVDDQCFCVEGVMHQSMDKAPAEGKAIAEAFAEACADILDIVVVSSEGDAGGEVFVIADPGPDPKQACLEALAVKQKDDEDEDIWETATIEDKNYANLTAKGFNVESDDDNDEDEQGAGKNAGILAVTRLMAERLEKHFKFSFEDNITVAPVIFGGYAGDGSIVGVLSHRVWT